MAVDLRKIRKLIELVEESGVAELEVRDGEECIRIARPVTPAQSAVPAAPPAPAAAVREPESKPESKSTFAFRAPMAGTFYRAPAPGSAPFVEVGQTVQTGQVLCIIESMKMMNEITAERDGVCTAVSAGNGEPVSSGDVLFRFA